MSSISCVSVNKPDVDYIKQAYEAEAFDVPWVYRVFIVAAASLTVFFAVCFILAFTSRHFLDWDTALVGLIGTAGLAVVGWLSKLQLQDISSED